ncbi:unnamed protein product [Symbiodinium microadriaticum]|nr:unnamed protein product [Symbiodinium microadriaticum]
MSFLQSLRNRERLLRWFDEVDFQGQLSNFHRAHASKFLHYEEGGPCDHSWHGLHEEYRRLYEDHLQQFLAREGMKQEDFVKLAGRYAKNLSGQEAEEWDVFLSKLTSCEEFSDFLETMKAVASGKTTLAQTECSFVEEDPSSPSRRVPQGVVAFSRHLSSSSRRRDLEAFTEENWCTFHVRFQEHRHEWYSLHQRFVRLFELAAEEALLAAGLEIGQLAEFLVHQLPLMGQPPALQDFLFLLSPAEDYVDFVEMMKARAAEFACPGAGGGVSNEKICQMRPCLLSRRSLC